MARRTYSHFRPSESTEIFRRLITEIGLGERRATQLYLDTLISGRTRIDYEDPTEPMTIFSVEKYQGDYVAAIADASAVNGIVEFAPNTKITGEEPITLTKRVVMHGFGRLSHFDYTGVGDPIRMQFANSDIGRGTRIHSMRITGRNLAGQNGISCNQPGVTFPTDVRLHDLELDGFLGGDGIFLHCALNCVIEHCRIQGALRPIALRTPCGTRVDDCWLNYWGNAGLHMYSPGNDGLAARCNSAHRNIIHGDPEMVQDFPQDRAGILVDGVSSSVIEGYEEDIDVPPGSFPPGHATPGPFFGHAVVFKKSGTALTQGNEIRGGFFGPNIHGSYIRTESGVTHTTIRRPNLGTAAIVDNGSFTFFDMTHMSDFSQLQGTGTNRRGWISLSNGQVVQLHT